jgi:uncharacterized protein with von Willebrand factor type A (vWA) domain
LQRFLSWKLEVQARLISLIINSAPGDLTRISDSLRPLQGPLLLSELPT